MEKVIHCSYNKEADELNISIGSPKKAISLEVGDEIYLRLHPKTKEILGFTIMHFEKRTLSEETFALPLLANFKLSKYVKEPLNQLIATN